MAGGDEGGTFDASGAFRSLKDMDMEFEKLPAASEEESGSSGKPLENGDHSKEKESSRKPDTEKVSSPDKTTESKPTAQNKQDTKATDKEKQTQEKADTPSPKQGNSANSVK